MTTLLPDRVGTRRTRIRVDAPPGGRVRVLATTDGDPGKPCLRAVILHSAPGYAKVALVPDGALLLAEDAIGLGVEVGAGTRLDLVEPAGTVAYDMRGGAASWEVSLRLAEGATLTWAGEPFVLSAGSSVRRSTDVTLGRGARLALRETLVLGRHDEPSGAMDQRWRARGPDGAEVLAEDLLVGDGTERPGILGGHRAVSSVVALGFRVAEDVAAPQRLDLDDLDGPGGTAGTCGTLWRALASHAHQADLHETWQAVLRAC